MLWFAANKLLGIGSLAIDPDFKVQVRASRNAGRTFHTNSGSEGDFLPGVYCDRIEMCVNRCNPVAMVNNHVVAKAFV